MTKRLGVTPYPMPNDALNGYLLNLAYCHGISKISELLTHIEMEKPKVKRWGVWDESEIENLIHALSIVCERDTRSSLIELCANEYPSWCFGETRMFREIRVDFPRVCPLCLIEKRQIHKHWGIGTVARCEVHKELLIDTCPKCDKQLIWKESLFNGCTHCNFKWSQHMPTPWTRIRFSNYEWGTHPNNKKPGISYRISGLCAALMAMSRPFDIHYQPHQRLPKTLKLSELILKALAILESNDARSQWVAAYRQIRPSRLVHERKPLDSLKDELNTYDIKFTDTVSHPILELKELDEYIKPARRKRVHGRPEDYRYHVHHDGLARALNLSSTDLMKLTVSETLPRTNSTSLIRDQLFDTRQISNVLLKFNQLPHSNNLVTVTPKTKALRTYFVNYGWLLKDILNKRLSGYFPITQDLSKVMVLKGEFKNWIIDSFIIACQAHQSKTNVIRGLGISKNELYELIETGELRWALLQHNGRAIEGDSLRHYVMKSQRYDFLETNNEDTNTKGVGPS